ncbi:MAG: hypothetical protein CMG21_01790 [Candidatus Marinimicrobia bacterium]|nr:hypothetical protein [Candidatus Neomarinimicrobiota bacterium]|tara:strand:- start:1398 stop:2126 length:729 start_codon:yes stop_codon:yes gene_type:complete
MRAIYILFSLTLLFSQNEIEGRWHLVGYEDNVMYQFVDTEPFSDAAGLRYTIYSTDGNFDDLDGDYTGGTPNPYSVVEDIITIDLYFGHEPSYQMLFSCDGQVVEFRSIENQNIMHSNLFREGYEYHNNQNCQCEHGSVINNNPCNPMECIDGQWYMIAIDCAEPMGIPCEGGLYISPPEGVCCSECISFGDINYDFQISILDVIQTIYLILDDNYNEIVDMNYDGFINILDIIEIIDLILN